MFRKKTIACFLFFVISAAAMAEEFAFFISPEVGSGAALFNAYDYAYKFVPRLYGGLSAGLGRREIKTGQSYSFFTTAHILYSWSNRPDDDLILYREFSAFRCALGTSLLFPAPAFLSNWQRISGWGIDLSGGMNFALYSYTGINFFFPDLEAAPFFSLSFLSSGLDRFDIRFPLRLSMRRESDIDLMFSIAVRWNFYPWKEEDEREDR